MLQKEHHKNLSNRLHYLCGQLKGIDKMIHENRSENDILIQFLAAESALRKLIYQHFDEALRKCLALKINALLEQKNISHKNREILIAISEQFPYYKMKQLPKVLYKLHQMEKNNRQKN